MSKMRQQLRQEQYMKITVIGPRTKTGTDSKSKLLRSVTDCDQMSSAQQNTVKMMHIKKAVKHCSSNKKAQKHTLVSSHMQANSQDK